MNADTVDKILALCDEFVPGNGNPPEYFFDRNPVNFPTILNVYRTDKFHMIEAGCALVFQKDLEYWAIDEYSLEPCCALKYFPEVLCCCLSDRDQSLNVSWPCMYHVII